MKLQLKRSNVLELGAAKEPTAAQMEYGELAVNYNNGDPAIFLKDSNDNIIRIAGVGSINSGDTPSGGVLPPTGNNVGDVFFNTTNNTMYYWDGTQWVPIANDVTAADIFVGTLAEIDAEVPKADRRNGFLWWNTEDGTLYIWYIDANTSQWVIAIPSSGGGGGGASVAVNNVPPTSPDQGDMWWNTNDGRLYIWYQDVDTGQWVDASPDNQGAIYWDRTGTTLSPTNAGDDVDLGTGDLSAAAGTFSGTGIFGGSSNPSNAAFTVQGIDGDNTGPGALDIRKGTAPPADGSLVGVLRYTNLNNTGNRQYASVECFADGTSSGDTDIPGRLALATTPINGSIPVQRLNVGADGNIGIGGTLPASPNITLRSDGKSDFYFPSAVATDGVLKVFSDNGGTKTLKWYVDSSGTQKCGGDAASAPLITLNGQNGQLIIDHVQGGLIIVNQGSASNSIQIFNSGGTRVMNLMGNGAAYKPGGGSWTDISDVRMKSNLTDYTAGLAEIKQLQPKTYDFHGREEQQLGFVAQEVEGVMPEMVSQETGTLPSGVEVNDLRSVNITAVHYATVNAIKEMATRIESLEAEVQALKGVN